MASPNSGNALKRDLKRKAHEANELLNDKRASAEKIGASSHFRPPLR